MRPLKTLLVGIIAFALGIVAGVWVSGRSPQQGPPVSVTKSKEGIRFENLTRNPVLVVGLANQKPTGFTIETGSAIVAPADSPTFLILEYQRTNKWTWRNDRIGPCYPADCVLPPPPPPPPFQVFQLDPRLQ